MRSWTLCFGAIVASVLYPAAAIACSCGGTVPSSLAVQHADVVFVGTVTRIDHPQPIATSHQNPDGSTSVTVDISSGPDMVIFDVMRVYKGARTTQLALLRGNSSCDLPFMSGETWVVYGEETNGGIQALRCSRTRLHADAAQDLAYLENARAKRPQGIVYGDVFRHRNGPSDTTKYAVREALEVIATDGTQTFRTTTDRWGPFELVLPPGDFEIWIERDHTPVTSRRTVHVQNGVDLRVTMTVEYSDNSPHR